jgi:ribosomal protein L40E
VYLQQTGRGLRPSDTKTHVKYFDHVNNWQRHGLPDDVHTWSLDGATKRASKSEMQAKRCASCYGVSPISAKVCRYCGAPFVVKSRKVIEEAGTLQEADLDVLRVLCGTMPAPVPSSPRSLSEWQAVARQRGHKSGWAWHRWKAQHGHPGRSQGI